MCYSPPGPRCSNHASEALRKAENAFHNASDSHGKMRFWDILQTAKANYYATPRGQNELLREIALLSNSPDRDSETDKKLTDLRIAFRKGQILRNTQLEAYNGMEKLRKTSVRETLNTNNKQKLAAGVTFNYLLDFYTDEEPHLEDDKTLTMNDKKVLILPTKMDIQVGVHNTSSQNEDRFIDELVTNNLTLNPKSRQAAERWLLGRLDEYTHFSSVDVYSEQLKLSPLSEIFRYYDFSFKMKKRLGGTANPSRKDVPLIEEDVRGTVFENSDIVQEELNGKLRTFVLYDQILVTEREQHVRRFYFKPYRTDNNSLYYEVRKKHQSTQTNIFVTFKRLMSAYLDSSVKFTDKDIQIDS